MDNSIIVSKDGSFTLKPQLINETYHSSNGAYTEAMHIYINSGVDFLHQHYKTEEITIIDIGLGTGLNCILSYIWQDKTEDAPKINYYGIEKFPLTIEKVEKLNYPSYLEKEAGFNITQLTEITKQIHTSNWETQIAISDNFNLTKIKADIQTINLKEHIKINSKTVIFYDTFSPNSQPELWSREIFKKLSDIIGTESILVTYSSKGTVKQALREAGFNVKRLPGPPMKRHILRATKVC